MTRVCVTGLESSVQTGDLILFSSKHAASHVTKCFTASTWDHCGLVVKLSPKHVFILEYAGGVYLCATLQITRLFPRLHRLATPRQVPTLHTPLLLFCHPRASDCLAPT